MFDREAFGFQRVTVEQPLRRVWQVTDDTLDALAESKAFGAWETKEIAADTGPFDRDADQPRQRPTGIRRARPVRQARRAGGPGRWGATGA